MNQASFDSSLPQDIIFKLNYDSGNSDRVKEYISIQKGEELINKFKMMVDIIKRKSNNEYVSIFNNLRVLLNIYELAPKNYISEIKKEMEIKLILSSIDPYLTRFNLDATFNLIKEMDIDNKNLMLIKYSNKLGES